MTPSELEQRINDKRLELDDAEYFNHAAPEIARLRGDLALLEQELTAASEAFTARTQRELGRTEQDFEDRGYFGRFQRNPPEPLSAWARHMLQEWGYYYTPELLARVEALPGPQRSAELHAVYWRIKRANAARRHARLPLLPPAYVPPGPLFDARLRNPDEAYRLAYRDPDVEPAEGRARQLRHWARSGMAEHLAGGSYEDRSALVTLSYLVAAAELVPGMDSPDGPYGPNETIVDPNRCSGAREWSTYEGLGEGLAVIFYEQGVWPYSPVYGRRPYKELAALDARAFELRGHLLPTHIEHINAAVGVVYPG